MKVCVTYIHPNLKPAKHVPAAKRFVHSFMKHPPGSFDEYELWVLVNGAPLIPSQEKLFDPLPVKFLNHDNRGKDIGAFQLAAEKLKCDLLVCFGSFVHFHWTGWLDRIVNTYLDYGPAYYGPWGFRQPRLHIRTTAFWLPPELLNGYPYWVSNDMRYEFEHGQKSMTLFSRGLGFNCYQVSRTEVLEPVRWHHLERHECILLDQHTDKMGFKPDV